MPFLAPIIAEAAIVGFGVTAGTAAIIGTVGATVIGLGVSVGISYAMAALNKPKAVTPQAASESGPAGVQTSVQYGGAVPRSAIYGRMATAGHLLYWNVYGTHNEYLQFVYAIGDGLHDGLEGMYVNGNVVSFGAADGTLGLPIVELEKDGTHYAWVRFFNGTEAQAADTELVNNATPSGRWTSAHTLSGIAYVSITMRYEETVFSNGVPTFLFVARGLRLYDPRLDSTNGGSGSHRWNEADTYEYSENPAVALYNYQRGLYLNDELILGQGVAPFDLITDMYVAAANICDEPVNLLAGGTEPRYRVGEQVSSDRQHREVIQDFLSAMAGQLLETAGSFGPLAGAPQISAATITDDDLIVGQPRVWSSHRSRNELINTISGSYSDPSQNWQPVAYPLRTSSSDELSDGERLGVQRDYPMINSATQVQRCAEIERRLARVQGTATEVYPFKFSVLEAGDWITRVSARFDYTKKFQIIAASVGADQSVSVSLREISDDVFAWDEGVDQLDPQVPGDLPGYGSPITTVSGFALEAVSLPGQSGLTQPALRAEWSPVADRTVTDVLVEYRLAADPTHVSTAPLFRPANGFGIISDGIQGGNTGYEARATIITQPARVTAFTAWIPVTSPLEHTVATARTASSVLAANIIGDIVATALADASVTAAKLHDQAVEATKFATGIEPVKIVTGLPSPSGYTGPKTVYNTVDGKLYRYAGGVFTTAVPTVDLTGQVVTAQIAAGAVTDAQIAAVAAAKLTGQITSTQITDNSISTPKLQAGSVSTANLAAGAVTTAKLAVGNGGGNRLTNSDFLAGNTGNVIIWQNNTGLTNPGITLNGDWCPQGMQCLYITYPSSIATPAFNTITDLGIWKEGLSNHLERFPVDAGKRYEASVYISSHRCNAAMWIAWLDGSGTYIAFDIGNSVNQSGASGSLAAFANARSVCFGTAPPAAVTAHLFVRTTYIGLGAGGNDPYTFISGVYFDEATPNQTEATPWGPGGATIINGGQLVTRSIVADRIVSNAITANELGANSIIAGKIAANAVTAGTIAGNSITAGELAANAVTAGTIAAGAVSTPQLAAGAVTSSIIAAGAIVASKIAVSGTEENLILNGGFEDGMSGWGSISDGVAQNIGPPYPHSGASGCYCTRGASGYMGIASALTPCAGGTVYEISTWRWPLDAVGNHYLYVNWYDSFQNYVTSNAEAFDAPGGYTKAAMQLTSPSNAAYAFFYAFSAPGQGGSNNAIVFDDYCVRKAAGVTLIEDGAITSNKIIAGAIVAGKIDAGAVNASSIIVDDLIVTGHIFTDAATKVAVQQTGTAFTYDGTNQLMCSLTVSNSGYKQLVHASIDAFTAFGTTTSNASGSAMYFSVQRDGSEITRIQMPPAVDRINGSSQITGFSFIGNYGTAVVDSPGAGSHTYEIWAITIIGGFTVGVTATLWTLEAKKSS